MATRATAEPAAVSSRSSRWHDAELRQDAAIAAAACAIGLLALVVEPENAVRGVRRGADALAVVLVLGMTLPLSFRRRAPKACLVIPAACAVVVVERGYAGSIAALFVLFGVASAAYFTPRPTAVRLGVATALVATGLTTFDLAGGVSFLNVLAGVLAGAVPAALGDAFRARAELMATVRAHAIELDRLREAEIRSAITQERVGIARDIHDIVGHHLSAISLQANAARRIARDGNPALDGALNSIASVSSQALGETRRMLELLREREPDLVPSPRLADLDQLADAARSAGVPVQVERSGTPREVPNGVETCAYRIVQEALTNVVKHARPARARVKLHYGDDALDLSVRDDGRAAGTGARPHPPGHGLVGMHERAGLVGGTFRAGPSSGGGWAVEASLPLSAG